MPWAPEWLGREGRPVHDLNTKEWALYREEADRVLRECEPADEHDPFTWVWRQGTTAGSRLLTPLVAARRYAERSYPGCRLGVHPGFGVVVFWNDRVFMWPLATPEEVQKDAVVGGFLAFGQEVQENDVRQVLVSPDRDIVHETAGHLLRARRTAGLFPPRTDGAYLWALETTPDKTWVRRYPLAAGPAQQAQEAPDDRATD